MVTGMALNMAEKSECETQEEKMMLLSKMTKYFSANIMFVPTVLLYLNTNPKVALLSALSQLVTENVGKMLIAWSTKKGFAAYIKTVHARENGIGSVVSKMALRASQEAGFNTDVSTARAEILQKENSKLKKENSELKNTVQSLRRRLRNAERGNAERGNAERAPAANGFAAGRDEEETEALLDERGVQSSSAECAFRDGEVTHEGLIKDDESSDGGVEAEGDEVDASLPGGEEGEEGDEAMPMETDGKRYKYALAMMALRWHAEIVAEKGSIINAALVAYLYFDGLVDATPNQLAIIGLIFFAVEVISDVIFVYIMHHYFEVPLLSAIPQIDVLSKDNLEGSFMMAMGYTAMSVCVAMAVSVPL
jgi:hypothetical protein